MIEIGPNLYALLHAIGVQVVHSRLIQSGVLAAVVVVAVVIGQRR